MKKKLFACLMVAALVLSAASVTVFAKTTGKAVRTPDKTAPAVCPYDGECPYDCPRLNGSRHGGQGAHRPENCPYGTECPYCVNGGVPPRDGSGAQNGQHGGQGAHHPENCPYGADCPYCTNDGVPPRDGSGAQNGHRGGRHH